MQFDIKNSFSGSPGFLADVPLKKNAACLFYRVALVDPDESAPDELNFLIHQTSVQPEPDRHNSLG